MITQNAKKSKRFFMIDNKLFYMTKPSTFLFPIRPKDNKKIMFFASVFDICISPSYCIIFSFIFPYGLQNSV